MDADFEMWVDVTHGRGERADRQPPRKDASQISGYVTHEDGVCAQSPWDFTRPTAIECAPTTSQSPRPAATVLSKELGIWLLQIGS